MVGAVHYLRGSPALPFGASAVVAIVSRFAEAVEGLLDLMEIGLAGEPSSLKGITVTLPLDDGALIGRAPVKATRSEPACAI
jgi:hypothetical protein